MGALRLAQLTWLCPFVFVVACAKCGHEREQSLCDQIKTHFFQKVYIRVSDQTFFIPEDRPGVVRNDYPLGQAPLVPQVTEFTFFVCFSKLSRFERGVLVSAATVPDLSQLTSVIKRSYFIIVFRSRTGNSWPCLIQTGPWLCGVGSTLWWSTTVPMSCPGLIIDATF